MLICSLPHRVYNQFTQYPELQGVGSEGDKYKTFYMFPNHRLQLCYASVIALLKTL